MKNPTSDLFADIAASENRSHRRLLATDAHSDKEQALKKVWSASVSFQSFVADDRTSFDHFKNSGHVLNVLLATAQFSSPKMSQCFIKINPIIALFCRQKQCMNCTDCCVSSSQPCTYPPATPATHTNKNAAAAATGSLLCGQ